MGHRHLRYPSIRGAALTINTAFITVYSLLLINCIADRPSTPMPVDVRGSHAAVVAVIAVICAVVATIAIAACMWRCIRRRQKQKTEIEMKSMTQRLL